MVTCAWGSASQGTIIATQTRPHLWTLNRDPEIGSQNLETVGVCRLFSCNAIDVYAHNIQGHTVARNKRT